MTEEITKKKVKIDDEDSPFEYDENLNIYQKESGFNFHVSELYNDNDSEIELFRKEAYDYMADGDNLYRLTYDNGSLKIPNSNIEILNDEELPELKNYNSGFFSSKLFYINEDFDTIYVREDKPKSILLFTGFGLGLGQIINSISIQSTIVVGILAFVGGIILALTIYYVLKKTRNLHILYDIKEHDVSHIDKLNG